MPRIDNLLDWLGATLLFNSGFDKGILADPLGLFHSVWDTPIFDPSFWVDWSPSDVMTHGQNPPSAHCLCHCLFR